MVLFYEWCKINDVSYVFYLGILNSSIVRVDMFLLTQKTKFINIKRYLTKQQHPDNPMFFQLVFFELVEF